MVRIFTTLVIGFCCVISSLKVSAQGCQAKTSSFEATICSGSFFYFADNNYTEAGTYKDTLLTTLGCDSIVTLTLFTTTQIRATASRVLCIGDSVFFGGSFRKTNGIYEETTLSADGCDSVTALTVTFVPQPVLDTTIWLCQGSKVSFNSKLYSDSGKFTLRIPKQYRCDSIIHLTIRLNKKYSDTTTISLCEGKSYLFYERTIIRTGIYRKVFTSATGCDSTKVVNITFLNTPSVPIISLLGKDTLSTNIAAEKIVWFRDGIVDTTLKTQVVKVTKSGSYFALLQSGNCLSDTSNTIKVDLIITGLENLSRNTGYLVYPNPTSGLFYLKSPKSDKFILYDLLGNKIKSATLSEGVNEIDVQDLLNGTYILQTSLGRNLISVSK